MAKEKKSKSGKKFKPELHPLHEPVFKRYRIGDPMVIGLDTSKLYVAAYYAGWVRNEDKYSIMYGSTKSDGKVNVEITVPEKEVLFTHLLTISGRFKCPSIEFAWGIFDIHLKPFSIIEFLDDNQMTGIGYTIRSKGRFPPDLAHTLFLQGEHDSWYKPAYLPREKLGDPNGKFSLNGIKSMNALEDLAWDWNNSYWG